MKKSGHMKCVGGPSMFACGRQLKKRSGDFDNEAVENVMASMLRDKKGGLKWFLARLEVAKGMALKSPGMPEGFRYY